MVIKFNTIYKKDYRKHIDKESNIDKDYVVEGIRYSTIKALAEAYGLHPNRIYKRFQRGKRGDDLIPLQYRKNYIPPTSINEKEFVVGDVTYKNQTDACRQLKIDYNKYRSRLRQGWSSEEALELVSRVDRRVLKHKFKSRRTRRNSNEPLIVFGKAYASYKAIAEAFGIKEYVIYQRVNKYGKTLEEAILMDGKNKKFKVGNVEYKNKADFARSIGIEPRTFYCLSQKYTIKQIIGIEDRMTVNSITYRGKWYSSRVALAEDYGLTKNQLYYRIYICNLSLDEALSITSNSSVVKSVFGNQGKLYIAEIIDSAEISNSGDKLYKVGVTQHNLSKRYSEFPFELKTVFCKEGDLAYLRNLEKEIKQRFQDKKFNDFTGSHFDGFTEIFRLNQSELNYLKYLVKFDLPIAGAKVESANVFLKF